MGINGPTKRTCILQNLKKKFIHHKYIGYCDIVIPLVFPVTLDAPVDEESDTRPQHPPRKPWMQHPEQDGNIQASCPTWRIVQDK